MATKQEVIDQLKAGGIEHDPNALKADLEALLPSTPDVSPETSEQSAVLVCDPHGHPHRIYSKEVHGDNFRQLAETYVSHPRRTGWTVK